MNKDFFNDMRSQIEPPDESVSFLLKKAQLTDAKNLAWQNKFVSRNLTAVVGSIALIIISGVVVAFGGFFNAPSVDPNNTESSATTFGTVSNTVKQTTATQPTEHLTTTSTDVPKTQTTPQISDTSPPHTSIQTASAPTQTTSNPPKTPAPQQISLERAIEIGYAEITNRGFTGTFRESCRGTSQGQDVWELLFRVQGGRLPLVEMYISMETGAIIKWEWDD
jgi:hypothetical protein